MKCLFWILALAAALTACGDDTTTDDTPAGDVTTDTTNDTAGDAEAGDLGGVRAGGREVEARHERHERAVRRGRVALAKEQHGDADREDRTARLGRLEQGDGHMLQRCHHRDVGHDQRARDLRHRHREAPIVREDAQ